MFASDDADWVAGKLIPAPLADAVVPPTPIVVANDGVCKSAIVPVEDGKVTVVVPATLGADSVTAPLVSPLTTILAIFILYKITQRWPDVTVTDTPDPSVTGPTDCPLYPLPIV